MNEIQLNKWIKDFEKEVKAIEIEFNAFFLSRKIRDYYSLRVNKASGYLSIDINRRDDLPSEVIDRLTVAYLSSKPK